MYLLIYTMYACLLLSGMFMKYLRFCRKGTTVDVHPCV